MPYDETRVYTLFKNTLLNYLDFGEVEDSYFTG